MRVTVFGAGALGSVLGGLMSESHTVSMVCRDDHARKINEVGLWINGLLERKVFPKASVSTEGLPVQDLVILTVKAFDTRAAMRSVIPLMTEDTSLLVIQNGLTVLRDVQELCPRACVGTASFGADLIGPGHVRLTGIGEIVIGNPGDAHETSCIALGALNSTGLPCRRSLEIRKEVWKKAVTSSCINPLTAITRKRNAVITEDAGINDLAKHCFRESFSVGVSAGVLETQDMAFTDVERIAKATSENRSSMLQDVERGRRTEVRQINGEIVRIGNGAGLDVGLNLTLLNLVSALSKEQDHLNVY